MKLLELPHVKYVRAKGRVYAYFNTGKKKDGKPIYHPLGQPGSVGFFDRYGSCVGARNRTPGEVYTFQRLCDDYQSSREFGEKLSAGTQKAYAVYLRLAVELLGIAPVNDITRSDIQEILDKANWGSGKRNLFVAVIGAAYKWGRARNRTGETPTREIISADTGERMAWPEEVLTAGLEADSDRVRLAVALLFYTGQRIGDVCAMRWASIKGTSIKVTQQKTGKMLTIPLHRDLRAELDRHGKKGLTPLTNAVGGPLSADALRLELKALVAANGHPSLVPHGLRKNAVIALLTAGCSVAETAAITGQTYQLVEYYARQIDQERMAEGAILKLEQSGPRKTSGKTGSESGGSA